MYHLGSTAAGGTVAAAGGTLAFTGADGTHSLWLAVAATTLIFAGFAVKKILPARSKPKHRG
jgi:hypothetical protein